MRTRHFYGFLETGIFPLPPWLGLVKQRRAWQMATDYDTPRKTDEELNEESIEELKARRADAQSGQVDIDEAELAETLELPGADLSGEELTVRVVPKQADEFTCSRCFLVHHRSQLARGEGSSAICSECI
jgi:hypothetical protein